jgi:hypothetical protein
VSSAAAFPKLDRTLRMDDPSLKAIQALAQASDRGSVTSTRPLDAEATGSWNARSVVVPPRRGPWLVLVAILVGAVLALGGLLLLARALHVAVPLPMRFR